MSDHTHDRPTGEPAPGQQNPYGAQNPYAPYQGYPSAQPGAGTDPYSQNPAAPNPYAQGAYTQNPYDPQNPYAQGGYGQDPYAQAPGQPGYGQPYSTAYGQSPYGTMTAYGRAAAPMRPSMGFGQAFKAYFQNYARFDGRASLSEYWWVQLANALITTILYVGGMVALVQSDSDGSGSGSAVGVVLLLLLAVWGLATIVPSLALTARRLHDTDKSGWMQLLGLIPLVGSIVMIVLCCGGSNPAGARFDGPDQPRLGD